MAFKIVSQTVTEVEDRDPNLYVQRAEDFLKKRKYTDALHAMDKSIEYSPHNKKNKYIFEKIKVYEAIGINSEAIEFIEKHIYSQYRYLSLEDFYRVLNVLNKNNAKNIKDILSHNQIPVVLITISRASTDTSRDKLIQFAQFFKESQQYTDALECISVIEDKYKEDVDSYLLKAQIFRDKDLYHEAISYYEKAASLPLAKEAVFIEIVHFFLQQKQNNEAIKWIDKGLKKFPNNLELLYLKIDLLMKDEKYDVAISVLDSILSYRPSEAKAIYLKGEIYDEMGKYFRAHQYFKTAQKLKPTFIPPDNRNRRIYLLLLKSFITVFTILIILLIVGQFILFKNGTFKPMIINASIAMDSEELFVGETAHAQEDFQYFPFYAKELDYKLEIIEPAIAEIDTNGNIKGLKEGTTQVQLIVGGKVEATREISVVKPSVVSFTMEVLNPILEVGDSTSLSLHIESDYSEVVPDIKYSSSDPSVAEIDENGNIQAYGVGVATITVDANGYTDMKEIEVKAKLNAIQLEVSDISLELGETYTLSPTLITEPAGEETWELGYSLSDTSVANISETGEIQALGYGETEITITSISGVEQTVLVTVTPNKVSNLNAIYDEYYGSIQLEWNSDYETDEEITYEIEMNVDGQEPSIMETTDTSFESNYVSSNTAYTFNVVSIIHGVRSEQETVSVHTPSDQENDIDEMEEEDTLDQEEELLNDQRREIINNLIGYWKRTDELGNETHDDRYLFIYEGGGPDFWRIDFETQHNSGKTEVAYIDQIMINENNIMFNKVHILFSTENSITLRYRKGGGYGGITYDNEGYVTEHFEKISKSEVEPLYLDRYSNIDLPD